MTNTSPVQSVELIPIGRITVLNPRVRNKRIFKEIVANIDQLGLKGLRRGGAVVSERHANFILKADGKATARDVRAVIDHVQLEVERRRHIHTYLGQSFTAERLAAALELLRDTMEFVPQVIILDRMELEGFDRDTVGALKGLAASSGAELWMACRTHREGPQGEPGHLPPPAERFEDLVDTGFLLVPQDAKVRLQVTKDRDQMLEKDLNVVLDPRTLLLETGIGAKR